ncbi:MAG: helix-turn-helix domain-containing protein [Bacteroides sp.]|nr:helix-turn-helix domain-containing protein [Bacteroides sp.]
MEKDFGLRKELQQAIAQLREIVERVDRRLFGDTADSGDIRETVETATWLDGSDIMRRLHISPRTLQTLRCNGTLAYSRIGNKMYYRQEDLDTVLKNNYVMYNLRAHGKEERSGHGNSL